MEDGHYRRYFHSSFASSVSDSSTFPPYLTAVFPASSFLLPFCLPFAYSTPSTHQLTVPPLSFRPSVIIYPSSVPVLHHVPPTLSSPPGSSQRYTTHVLTERRTSNLRGSRCDPLRVRHPPDGGRLGVAPRAVLSPSRLSRRLSSRLETIRYAGDPGPSTSNPGSR